MSLPHPPPDQPLVILSGAGLSAASGVPTFRGEGGWWRGHRATDLATPEAFARDPDLVLRFYGMRREKMVSISPNAGHDALVSLQAAWGTERVVLVTQNVDGLLQTAADNLGVRADVIEMHGSLWTARCSLDDTHPRVALPRDAGDHRGTCAVCGAVLRPQVVWFGEQPSHLARIQDALFRCGMFVAVGTSGSVYPAAGFAAVAARRGIPTLEINPAPTGGAFSDALAETAETALPRLVSAWIGS